MNYEALFKNKLKKLKSFKEGSHALNGFYIGELFKKSSWYLLDQSIEEDDQKEMVANKETEISEEKLETLNSLNKFVENKIEESPKKSFNVPGGTIKPKEDPSNNLITFDVSEFSSEATIIQPNSNDGQLNDSYDVLFVGLPPKDLEKGDLLSKMISATKIPSEKFLKIYITKQSNADELFHFLDGKNIKYIIALGAKATDIVLNERKKMSEVHGKFFNIKVNFSNSSTKEAFSTEVMPVFHSDFLNINTKMKESAWKDLQKLMEKLDISNLTD